MADNGMEAARRAAEEAARKAAAATIKGSKGQENAKKEGGPAESALEAIRQNAGVNAKKEAIEMALRIADEVAAKAAAAANEK